MRDAVGNVSTVAVLGGGSDIAAAIVTELIGRRARTVVLAGRSPDRLLPVADRLRAAGADDVTLVTFDSADIESHERVADDVFAAVGDLDLAIVAFGQNGAPDVHERPADAARLAVTNYAGAVSATLAVANRMRDQGHGTIVVLSSVAGDRVRADNFVYGSTKAGLDGFTQGLAARYRDDGVRVLVVRPGFVKTKLTEGMTPAPFSTTPDEVAADVVHAVDRGVDVVYSPRILEWLFRVLRHLPGPLFRRLG